MQHREKKANERGEIKNRRSHEAEFITTKSSRESEDPLTKLGNLDFPGLVTGRVLQEKYSFALSYAHLIDICRSEYHRLADSSAEFKRLVPFCIYQYYVVQHFWARVCAIKEHSGTDNKESIDLMKEFTNKQYPLLSVISAYLRSIGDFTDEDSVEAEIVLPPMPNLHGDYGRVSHLTHNYYEAAPAPRICVESILASVASAGQPEAEIFWELPDNIGHLEPVGEEAAPENEAVAPEIEEAEQQQVQQQPPGAGIIMESPSGFPTSFELGQAEVEPEHTKI